MNYQDIIKAFSNNSKNNDRANSYSVLIPIIEINNDLHLLFEIRSFTLKHQPGEICFPGGKIEPNESPLFSAIRETEEEIGIKQENIEVVGELKPISTLFNTTIYSFCAINKNININKLKLNKDEVDSIFTVPLSHFIQNPPTMQKIDLSLNFSEDFPYHLIQGGRNYDWRTNFYEIYFYQYQNQVIWGLTAKILKNFIDIITK
ncbi:CoA pyrophosphatase [Serpentinicella sp. ANB-PHB4]|uniref:NUDIX hydrolase n=1 Tax=Serpentinicella sp. ANB-PHB4 TaxID=3074076 RepID=UPI0028617AF5|nr:CoA pyrophosphatase [Serpentinicella sp. ANB-PHB4]MDR5658012.1 CoA pyrophosphatase [Serpentinicella sp. ANB-PHB4]